MFHIWRAWLILALLRTWSFWRLWHHVQVDQVSGLKKLNIAAEYLSSTQQASVKAKVWTTRSVSSALQSWSLLISNFGIYMRLEVAQFKQCDSCFGYDAALHALVGNCEHLIFLIVSIVSLKFMKNLIQESHRCACCMMLEVIDVGGFIVKLRKLHGRGLLFYCHWWGMFLDILLFQFPSECCETKLWILEAIEF
jgi:hypothetical protein